MAVREKIEEQLAGFSIAHAECFDPKDLNLTLTLTLTLTLILTLILTLMRRPQGPAAGLRRGRQVVRGGEPRARHRQLRSLCPDPDS